MSGHQPGRIHDKRGTTKPGQTQHEQPRLTSYFDPITFIPARGYALLEIRFIGTSSTIHIPDQVHAKQQFGMIRAMGAGKLHYQGGTIEPEWQVGDFVYAVMTEGRRIEEGDRKFLLIGTEWILGKFPEVPQAVVEEFQRELEKGKAPEPTVYNAAP